MPDPTGLAELTALVRDCSVSGVERRVLLLRTDLLPDRLSRPHHFRLAQDALEPLIGADRARRHELAGGPLAVSWRGDAAERVQRVLASLEHLLQDAPLEAPALSELVRLFELPKDGAALLAVGGNSGAGRGGGAGAASKPQLAPLSPAAESPARAPLDLMAIEAIETQLAAANVARFARRRMVCRLGASTFTPGWETRFLSIQELMAALCPDRNAFAEPWLFRRLTRMLDRRMLSLLTNPAELREAGPFGLDLNVGGVLSPEFQRFDSTLPSRLRGQTVLNLHPADVMGDLPSFRFAAAFARARGYLVMLRAITPPMLPVLDLAALELDFVELRWSPTLLGFDPTALRAGTARWLLTRADDGDAIRWGRAVGIGLFQGNAVRAGAGLVGMRSAA